MNINIEISSSFIFNAPIENAKPDKIKIVFLLRHESQPGQSSLEISPTNKWKQ